MSSFKTTHKAVQLRMFRPDEFPGGKLVEGMRVTTDHFLPFGRWSVTLRKKRKPLSEPNAFISAMSIIFDNPNARKQETQMFPSLCCAHQPYGFIGIKRMID
jgi:hypothetical protein